MWPFKPKPRVHRRTLTSAQSLEVAVLKDAWGACARDCRNAAKTRLWQRLDEIIGRVDGPPVVRIEWTLDCECATAFTLVGTEVPP